MRNLHHEQMTERTMNDASNVFVTTSKVKNFNYSIQTSLELELQQKTSKSLALQV